MSASKSIGDLREERVDLHDQLDGVLKLAERENRDLRAAERQKFDRLEQRCKALDAEIGEYDRGRPHLPGCARVADAVGLERHARRGQGRWFAHAWP